MWDNAVVCGKELLHGGLCPKFSGKRSFGPQGYDLHVDDYNPGAYLKQLHQSGGMYEQQFNATFQEIGPDRVNCWVRTENLEADSYKCLREYQRLTGHPVNFAALDGQFDNHGHHG